MSNYLLTRWFSCQRVYAVPLLLLWMFLCFFKSMDYSTTLTKLTTRSFLRISADPTLPLWIIPKWTTPKPPSNWSAPENWTILLSPEMVKIKSCPSCYQAGDALAHILQSINAPPLQANSSVGESYRRLATALFALKKGAVSVLMTSDIISVNKSMSRLLLDNQPDGVKGIEYIGGRLTLDSYHFLHREGVSLGNPCKYRLRKRMNPVLTVGIRCQASIPNPEEPGTVFLIDSHSPPIFSSSPKFSVSDFSNSFFDYDGLWAMFPSFLSEKTRTSVWGLWAQRLIQEMGGEVAITSLSCPKSHKMLIANDNPSGKMLKTFDFIKEWKCPVYMRFYECALNLGQKLLQADLVNARDIKLLWLWLNELAKSHYTEPRRQVGKSSRKDVLTGCIIHSPARVVLDTIEIEHGNPFPNIYPFCKNLPKRKDVIDPFGPNKLSRSTRVKDIALVVIFYDASIYANIRYLQDLYARYFPHLIYCGPDFSKFFSVYKSLRTPLSFIEVQDTKGFVAYECVSRAIMMNYDVNGYLEMADDVILNTWTLGNVPRDRFWFQKDLKTASRHQRIMNDFAISFPVPWWPWTIHGQMWGYKAMARVWKVFESIQTDNDTKSNEIVTAFLSTLHHNSGAYDLFFYCSSDIFYVPSKFRQPWAMLSDIFFTNNVFLDIAVPTLMNGIDSTGNIIRMDGIYLWYNERGNYPAHYRNYHQFFHPWKMGWIHRTDHANFMCYHILPNIVKDLKVTTNHTELDSHAKRNQTV